MEPAVGLNNASQKHTLALNGLGVQCLVISTEVFESQGCIGKLSLLRLTACNLHNTQVGASSEFLHRKLRYCSLTKHQVYCVLY